MELCFLIFVSAFMLKLIFKIIFTKTINIEVMWPTRMIPKLLV